LVKTDLISDCSFNYSQGLLLSNIELKNCTFGSPTNLTLFNVESKKCKFNSSDIEENPIRSIDLSGKITFSTAIINNLSFRSKDSYINFEEHSKLTNSTIKHIDSNASISRFGINKSSISKCAFSNLSFVFHNEITPFYFSIVFNLTLENCTFDHKKGTFNKMIIDGLDIKEPQSIEPHTMKIKFNNSSINSKIKGIFPKSKTEFYFQDCYDRYSTKNNFLMECSSTITIEGKIYSRYDKAESRDKIYASLEKNLKFDDWSLNHNLYSQYYGRVLKDIWHNQSLSVIGHDLSTTIKERDIDIDNYFSNKNNRSYFLENINQALSEKKLKNILSSSTYKNLSHDLKSFRDLIDKYPDETKDCISRIKELHKNTVTSTRLETKSNDSNEKISLNNWLHSSLKQPEIPLLSEESNQKVYADFYYLKQIIIPLYNSNVEGHANSNYHTKIFICKEYVYLVLGDKGKGFDNEGNSFLSFTKEENSEDVKGIPPLISKLQLFANKWIKDTEKISDRLCFISKIRSRTVFYAYQDKKWQKVDIFPLPNKINIDFVGTYYWIPIPILDN